MESGPVVRFLCALPQSAFAQHAAATRSLSPEAAPRPVTTAGTSARRIAWYGLGTLLLGLLAVSPLHAQTATVGNTVPLGGGFQLPYGVAVDASGNVYVADEQGSAVKEMPPGCATSTCVTTLGAGFLFPTSVAVDSSGNVYVADYGNSAVKEMTPGCATSSCVKPLGGGFVNPQGVAVDSSGNVYVADYGNNAVKEMTPNCTSSSCVTPLGAGFVSPAEVAVDASDNVYVTDGQNNGAVKEMTPDCTSSSCVTMLGGGFNSPFGVAVDGSGNIYVGDTGNYVMKEMPSGCAASTCVITLFADVVGVAVSASGILYVSDVNADNNTVDEFFPQSLRLHAVAVRSTGPAVPVSFYFTAGGSGISATVVTAGRQRSGLRRCGNRNLRYQRDRTYVQHRRHLLGEGHLDAEVCRPALRGGAALEWLAERDRDRTHLRHRPGAADPVPEQSDYRATGRRLQLSLWGCRRRCRQHLCRRVATPR